MSCIIDYLKNVLDYLKCILEYLMCIIDYLSCILDYLRCVFDYLRRILDGLREALLISIDVVHGNPVQGLAAVPIPPHAYLQDMYTVQYTPDSM